jgi:DNA-binding NtrC family response regulator
VVLQGGIRLDLYQRLNDVRLSLPPLGERMEGLPKLMRVFVRRYCRLYCPIERIEPELTCFLES